jgi:hypothetical protein
LCPFSNIALSGGGHADQAAWAAAVASAAVAVWTGVRLIETGSNVARRSSAAAAIQAIPPPIECRFVIVILLESSLFIDADQGAQVVPERLRHAISKT